MLDAVARRAGALLDGLGIGRAWHDAGARLRSRGLRRESVLLRTQRDMERLKLAATTVLRPDRAVTLVATGDRIYVDPRDRGCGSNLMHEGRYEEDELRLFRSMLAPGATVLDIGANYGYYSLCAAPFVRPGGRVIAFEPNPHIHELLRSSVVLNGYDDVVEARCLGVSDVAGTLGFVIDETGPGGAHVDDPAHPPPPHWLRTEVPVCRLDDELPADLVVDVAKMDVEGHEEHALRGMRRLIARSPDIKIFMEFIYVFLAGEDAFERFIRLITDELGLRINRVLPNGRTAEVDMAGLKGASCTLILSRRPLEPAPELTVHGSQLRPGDGAEVAGGVLAWQRPDGPPARRTIGNGGNLYLPQGRYRMAVDGEFDGPFLLRLVASGELLWEERLTGRPGDRRIALPLDAPRLEVVLIAPAGRSRAMRLRTVRFWRY